MPRTHVAIIGAPLDLGQDRRGVDMGPSAVRVANLNARVASLGYEVEDWGNIPVEQKEAWPEGEPHAKYLAQIAAACSALARAWTRRSRTACCRWCWAAITRSRSARSAASHAISARAAERVGLIWLDAHADMNTPESSAQRQHPRHAAGVHSGRGPGGTGRPRRLPSQGGRRATPSSSDCATWITLEKPHVRDSGIRAFTMRDIDERGLRAVMDEAIRIAGEGTAGIHCLARHGFLRPGGRARRRHSGARRRHLSRGAFGHGNDLRFAAHGLDGSGRSESGDRRSATARPISRSN